MKSVNFSEIGKLQGYNTEKPLDSFIDIVMKRGCILYYVQ